MHAGIANLVLVALKFLSEYHSTYSAFSYVIGNVFTRLHLIVNNVEV